MGKPTKRRVPPARRNITQEERMPRTPQEAILSRDFFRQRTGPRAYFSSPFFLAARRFGRKPLYEAMQKQGMSYSQLFDIEATYHSLTSKKKLGAGEIMKIAGTSLKRMGFEPR